MTIKVEIIEDSVAPHGQHLTTFLLYYPRMVHAEVLRARVFNHSVGSSRAVPVKRMLANIIADPAEPVEWGSNQPGMVAGAELTGWRLFLVKQLWHSAKRSAVNAAWLSMKLGLHKQVTNRLTETWSHTTQVLTATEYDGFYQLRCHEHADPTIRLLAEMMREAAWNHTATELQEGEWHLPFVTDGEKMNFPDDILRKVSAARCARTSYLNHDKSDPMISDDLKLAERLIESHHWSPFEHSGTPAAFGFENNIESNGNFVGWIQGRKLMENV